MHKGHEHHKHKRGHHSHPHHDEGEHLGPLVASCHIQGKETQEATKEKETAKAVKKKGHKKHEAHKSKWAGECKVQRYGVGVEAFVPHGATDRSLSLTVTMRDFDLKMDNHPFAPDTSPGRPASQVIEIKAHDLINDHGIFNEPIQVRFSHNIADLKRSSLSAVMAEAEVPLDYEGPYDQQEVFYKSYKKVASLQVRQLTATVSIKEVGKLILLDSSNQAVHHVYIQMDLANADPDMLSCYVPVQVPLEGRLRLYPKCCMWRPKEAAGPFSVAVLSQLARFLMRPQQMQARLAGVLGDPLAYPERFLDDLQAKTALGSAGVGNESCRRHQHAAPEISFLEKLTDPHVVGDVGDGLSRFIGEKRGLILHEHQFKAADAQWVPMPQAMSVVPAPVGNDAQQSRQYALEEAAEHPQSQKDGPVRWEGQAVALAFSLSVEPVQPLAHAIKMVVEYELRDEAHNLLLTLPECMTLTIVSSFICVHVKGILGHLKTVDLEIPFPLQDSSGRATPTLSTLRHLTSMRLVGWPLDHTKFAPGAGRPFEDWTQEARIGLREWSQAARDRVFLWGPPVRPATPTGSAELVYAASDHNKALVLGRLLLLRGCPVVLRMVEEESVSAVVLTSEKDQLKHHLVTTRSTGETHSYTALPAGCHVLLISPSFEASLSAQQFVQGHLRVGMPVMAINVARTKTFSDRQWVPAARMWLHSHLLALECDTVVLPKGDWRIKEGSGEADLAPALDKLAMPISRHCFHRPAATTGLLDSSLMREGKGQKYGEVECMVDGARHLPQMLVTGGGAVLPSVGAAGSGSTSAAFKATYGSQVVRISAPVLKSYDPVFKEGFRFRYAAGKSLRITLIEKTSQGDKILSSARRDLIGATELDEHALAAVLAECARMHSDSFVWKSLRLLGPSAGEREQMRQAATLLLQQADDPKKGKNDANKKKDGSTTAFQKKKKQTVATVDEEVEGIDGMKATLTLAFRYVPASATADLSATQGMRW